jgi:hypothetical protein
MKKREANDMNQKPPFFLASTVAAMGTIIVPIIGILFVYSGGPSIDADGTPDNAPYRAAVFLLFLAPLIFLIVFGAWYSTAKILASQNSLSIRSLLLACVAVSIITGSIFAADGYRIFGLRDGMISFLSFFLFTFVSLGLGTLAWWFIGKKLHNKEDAPDRKAVR